MRRTFACGVVLVVTITLCGCVASVRSVCSKDSKGRLVLDVHRTGAVAGLATVAFWVDGETFSWRIENDGDGGKVSRFVYGVVPPEWMQDEPAQGRPPTAIPEDRVFYLETKYIAWTTFAPDPYTTETTDKFRIDRGGTVQYLGKAIPGEGLKYRPAPENP